MILCAFELLFLAGCGEPHAEEEAEQALSCDDGKGDGGVKVGHCTYKVDCRLHIGIDCDFPPTSDADVMELWEYFPSGSVVSVERQSVPAGATHVRFDSTVGTKGSAFRAVSTKTVGLYHFFCVSAPG